MGDPVAILASPLAQPVAQIYYNSLGMSGGIAFTIFAFLIIQFVCWTAMQALARTVFAFSRDKLLPFSSTWTVINQRTQTPLNAVWISTFWCIVINLIGLGSYAGMLALHDALAYLICPSHLRCFQHHSHCSRLFIRYPNHLQADLALQIRSWPVAPGQVLRRGKQLFFEHTDGLQILTLSR